MYGRPHGSILHPRLTLEQTPYACILLPSEYGVAGAPSAPSLIKQLTECFPPDPRTRGNLRYHACIIQVTLESVLAG